MVPEERDIWVERAVGGDGVVVTFGRKMSVLPDNCLGIILSQVAVWVDLFLPQVDHRSSNT